MRVDPIVKALRVDVQRTRRKLPAGLEGLADVVWNVVWSWLPDGIPFFRDIDPGLWESSRHNPRAVLEGVGPQRLAELAADPGFMRRAEALVGSLQEYLARPAAAAGERVHKRHKGRPVAYFCAEYGLHESIPIYSGGLGILAGDHLKSSSDLSVPLVGVGLRYRQGYFQQGLDRSGWQVEYYEDTDFGRLPCGLILKRDRTPLTITVPFHNRTVTLQMWGLLVGRVPLLLLDTNRDDNDPIDRWITGHLYGGSRDTRLAQEMVLGIGGVRALRMLGYDPAVFHMNEGHAAFLGLELLREELSRGAEWDAALEAVRGQTVFTTHTPVPAGHDVFERDRIGSFMGDYFGTFPGVGSDSSRERLLALGRKHPAEMYEDFGMTPLAIHTSRSTNGVSRLHGEVCREMWSPMWPKLAAAETPISYVTNGVHAETWISPLLRELFDTYLGSDWALRQTDPRTWEAVDKIPDEELWEAHRRSKLRLVQFVRERARLFRRITGESEEYVQAADELLDPDGLVFGFARRVATYKRLSLLLHDRDRALSLLAIPGKPVQFVVAGKAHPGDTEAKRLLQYLFQVRFDRRVLRRATVLVNYDISVGREMVQGTDVWLNLPRRPLEASGTSGMKAAMNGVLNCSILDGWWAEGYNGKNGWAIGGEEEDADTNRQDAGDAESLYSTIQEKIIPLYYKRDAQGIPRGWIAMMKESIKTSAPVFNTDRMVSEYAERIYAPAVGQQRGERGQGGEQSAVSSRQSAGEPDTPRPEGTRRQTPNPERRLPNAQGPTPKA